MINIRQEVDLKSYNTFGISAVATVLVDVDNADELAHYLHLHPQARSAQLLGGGSNVLFVSQRIPMVIRPAIQGIEIVRQEDEFVVVKAGAGVVWDEFVDWCVKHNYSGLENLSLIPGTVGAAPIQNIGAYGTEVKEHIEAVETIEIDTGKIVKFDNSQCRFAYRDSYFKQNKGKYTIISVYFKLSKFFEPNLTYRDLQLELSGITDITIDQLRRAVTNIRISKLPDVNQLGNAGSFFKNPTINIEKTQKIRQFDPLAPVFPAHEGHCKISAAWLIRQCGWSNKREENVGVHKNQPLVIVNYGGATGKEVVDFADKISVSVMEKFGVELEREVNIVL